MCECRRLKAIIIPSSVYEIGCDAFYRCEALKEITIPSQVNVIEGGTFQLCRSLESVSFECAHVARIERWAFGNCKKLNRVTASGEQLSNSLVFNSRFCPFCDTPFLDKRLSEFQEE